MSGSPAGALNLSGHKSTAEGAGSGPPVLQQPGWHGPIEPPSKVARLPGSRSQQLDAAMKTPPEEDGHMTQP